jgi:UDP-N-acetylmuramoylalanine--D-glutamate ligase
MDKGFFAGRKVLVMGLGRFGGGVDVAKFACGAGAKVTVTDLAAADKLADSIGQLKDFKDIAFHLGSHEPADFENADIVIANPAVPPDNKFLKIAHQANKFVTSQINIFLELCPAPIIGITGSNGKSTTTALTAHLLQSRRDRQVWLSGNIGNEPLLANIDKIGPDDLVVLELSSFQIEQFARRDDDLPRRAARHDDDVVSQRVSGTAGVVSQRAQIQKSPKAALLTNLTPNHLDRHGTFENYCAAKENIFKFQKSDAHGRAISIFNAEDKVGMEWFEKYKNDSGRICIKFSPDDVSKEIRKQFTLPGRANLSNLAAALAIARQFGVKDAQIKACLPKFKALPHRLEFVAEINGVRWYNDSKATTPASSIVALDAFEQPKIIIAGGSDKHLPFDKFGEKIAQKAKAAILIGQTAPKIADAIKAAQLEFKIEFADSLAKAVELANQLAEPGDVVLLSTACASYDMFTNYEQRGEQFAELVRKIPAK